MESPEDYIHQQNVNWWGSNTQSSQTLRATSPVLLHTSSCSQAPLELSNVLWHSARAFSGAPESTCSYGGACSMLQDLTNRIVNFGSTWDVCIDLWDMSRAAGTAMQLRWRLREHCGWLGAIFSQQWFLQDHKAFHLFIFVFVTVTRFATSQYGMHYWSFCIYRHTANLAADDTPE